MQFIIKISDAIYAFDYIRFDYAVSIFEKN